MPVRALQPAALKISQRIRILSDFDGTITNKDSLKLLLDRFVGDSWRRIENRMKSGALSEREALKLAFEKFPLSEQSVMHFIDEEIRPDPFFKPFLRWVTDSGMELEIAMNRWQQQLLCAYVRNLSYRKYK